MQSESVLIKTVDIWSGRIWSIFKYLHDLWNMRINKLMHVNISLLKHQAMKSAVSRALTTACNAYALHVTTIRNILLRNHFLLTAWHLRPMVSLTRSEQALPASWLWLALTWLYAKLFVDALIFPRTKPDSLNFERRQLTYLQSYISYSL